MEPRIEFLSLSITPEIRKIFDGAECCYEHEMQFRFLIRTQLREALRLFLLHLKRRHGIDQKIKRKAAVAFISGIPDISHKNAPRWLAWRMAQDVSFDITEELKYGAPKPEIDFTPKKTPPKPKKKNLRTEFKKLTLRQTKSDFYVSEVWMAMRELVFQKYGKRCMRGINCGGPLQIDHIKPRSKFPELELDFNNLQVLCKSCNDWKSNVDYTDFRPKPAPKGNLG